MVFGFSSRLGEFANSSSPAARLILSKVVRVKDDAVHAGSSATL